MILINVRRVIYWGVCMSKEPDRMDLLLETAQVSH